MSEFKYIVELFKQNEVIITVLGIVIFLLVIALVGLL